MDRNREAFRKRFLRWKNGEKVYDNGRPAAIQEVDKSDADFARRLRSNWREEIWDWEKSGKSVTHKIAGADNIVYPNVLTTKSGGLIDFTNPIWKGNVDPYERAIKNNDYVPMKTEEDAIWFGPNYKKYYPGFKCGKLPKYGDGIIPVTTGGTGMPAPLFYGGISEEARPTADVLERIANFAPYVGTILDILEVVNGNLAKTPSAVIGAVADVALPGIRTAWKGIKAAKTAVLSAPMLIDKIKNYKLLQKLQKKFVANVAYQGIGTYQDILDDQGYIKSTKQVPKHADGKIAWYDQDKDLYYGGSLPEVTVTGEKRNHSAIDYLLWKADRAGAPSHITNAVRDFSNRALNFPIIAADAVSRYIKHGDRYNNILQAYKDADVNPSIVSKKLLVYPYTNDENNYSKEELAAMRQLSDITGKGTGAIGYKAYRQVNNGRYAGDINFKDFNKPNKVVEWSLGQTERKNGDDPYLYDNFSYDTKDTKGVYLNGALHGNVNPIMALRSAFGIIGSKGYDDGTNSATSIKTRIPTRYLRK